MRPGQASYTASLPPGLEVLDPPAVDTVEGPLVLQALDLLLEDLDLPTMTLLAGEEYGGGDQRPAWDEELHPVEVDGRVDPP